MAPKVAANADPRAGGVLIKPYRRVKRTNDEISPDFLAILALLLGILGSMSKNKLAAWGAVFVSASSFVNIRRGEVDYMQLVCSYSFSALSLIACYLARRLKSTAEREADTSIFG
mmetsp:Transcript_4369/g.8953  ORF Transcript_4369/g.8953 Transcript_4369/m.8953 type:complete len:115 (-) Transcript_4369:203-547(-)